ncbi:hypothetical protein GGR54DRAFT_617734 [Hypoxylon sp. NC1633]|nr:hypothetical protein GGR54DRAFT_617734 [Hypoxylon sp. NC1633]
MPRPQPDHDFSIYVDQSCLSTPMDEERAQSQTIGSTVTYPLSRQETNTTKQDNTDRDTSQVEKASSLDRESHAAVTEGTAVAGMTMGDDQESVIRPSIESDHPNEMGTGELDEAEASGRVRHDGFDKHGNVGDSSMLGEKIDDSHDHSQTDHSYPAHPDDGGDSSSHHEATDEDVFSDKSPRSSMGSYDGMPDSSKAHRDFDNIPTTTRAPRISDISQYEKEEFVPTARGTPRPPFRTPSDVRAIQMSSPTPSVLGSPRSAKRQFPTVSRVGTPSAQYSPKLMSTPSRFKGRKEPPLVLLHVTLLPLRWVWTDLLNDLDTDKISEQVKVLRESWRLLQDRLGDTVLERGILLSHPQNDYEVLEERLLEALELPQRRRARILECGHYLGPANEPSLTEDEESEDEWGSVQSRAKDKRHWCKTCSTEIRYDSLGPGKSFRVKVYASNGLVKEGAWAACWKEMERVDAELEPLVEPAVQEELIRHAAAQQERELTHQEEAEIAEEVAQQLAKQHQKEREELMHSSRVNSSSPHPDPEPVRSPTSAEERRWRDEERLREIYGHTPPPSSSPQSPSGHSREPSVHPHEDSFVPPPSPSPPSPKAYERKDSPRRQYKNASLPELVLQSVRVLMQDRKNVIIFTLSALILVLALRSAPAPVEQPYEPVIHRMRDGPLVRRVKAVEAPQKQVQVPTMDSIVVTASCGQPQKMVSQQRTMLAEPVAGASERYQDSQRPVHQTQTPISEPTAFASEGLQEHAPQADTNMIPQEPLSQEGYQHTTEPELAESRPDHHGPSNAVPQKETPAPESSTVAACYEDLVDATPRHGSSEAEALPATSHSVSSEIISQPTASQESVSASASVSTVYEPCNTPEAAQAKVDTVQWDETETETVTEKKLVRVVHTVTETEVETATETVKLTSTNIAKQYLQLIAAEQPPTENSSPVTSSELEELAGTVEAAAELAP